MNDDMQDLIEAMKRAGWAEAPGGGVWLNDDGSVRNIVHPSGLAFPTWKDAILACIEVASEV